MREIIIDNFAGGRADGVQPMKRIDVLKQIFDIREGPCKACSIPSDILRQHPGHLSMADNHCNKVCEQGAKLQELGKQLTLPTRKGDAVAG